jgi:hypothetical protein
VERAFFGPVGTLVGLVISTSLVALLGIVICLLLGVAPPPYSNEASKFYFYLLSSEYFLSLSAC